MKLCLDDDAFGHAQMVSKRHMVQAIESCWSTAIDLRIDLYAGWYGMLALMFSIGGKRIVGAIRTYDIDPEATAIALRLNRALTIDGFSFTAFTKDINDIHPDQDEVDIIINTSVEHMDRDDWFHNIPSGMMVGLQGTDMIHENEIVPNPIRSIDHLLERYPLKLLNGGAEKIDFEYSGRAAFSRYQILGRKL